MLQFLPCYVGYHVCAFFLSRVQAINSDTYIYPRMPARARPHTNTHTHINICMTDDWEAMFPSCEHNFIQVDNGTNNADWHITVMTWLTKSYWIDFCPTQIHLRLSAVTSTISHTGGPKHAVHVTSRTMDNCSLQLPTPFGSSVVTRSDNVLFNSSWSFTIFIQLFDTNVLRWQMERRIELRVSAYIYRLSYVTVTAPCSRESVQHWGGYTTLASTWRLGSMRPFYTLPMTKFLVSDTRPGNLRETVVGYSLHSHKHSAISNPMKNKVRSYFLVAVYTLSCTC